MAPPVQLIEYLRGEDLANTKVRLRWSDNIAKAIEFEASRETFASEAVDALIDARNLASRRYHAGEWRRDVTLYQNLELQLFDSDNKSWTRLGELIDTAFGPRTAWVPRGYSLPSFMAFPKGVPEGMQERQESDAETIIRDARNIMAMIDDTLEWVDTLGGIARGLSEQAFG